MSKVYRRIVPVYINDDYITDGPTHALIVINEEGLRRIQTLQKAVQDLGAAYIEDYDCSPEMLRCIDKYIDTEEVTDKTPKSKLPLFINSNNKLTAIRAKNRLAGNSIYSDKTIADIKKELFIENDTNMECEMIRVNKTDVIFKGIIKHTNISYFTEFIPIKKIQEVIW